MQNSLPALSGNSPINNTVKHGAVPIVDLWDFEALGSVDEHIEQSPELEKLVNQYGWVFDASNQKIN